MDYDKFKLHRVGDDNKSQNLSLDDKRSLREQLGADQETGLYKTDSDDRNKNIENLGANLGLVDKSGAVSNVDYAKLAKDVGMENVDPNNVNYEELEKRLRDIQDHKLQEESDKSNQEKADFYASQEGRKYKSNEYYRRKAEDLRSKRDAAKAEKEKDYKMKDKKDTGPVKADKSNITDKNIFDKLSDNGRLLSARAQIVKNKLDSLKNTANKIANPVDAAEEAVKEAAKDVVRKPIKKAKASAKKAVKNTAKSFIKKNPWIIIILLGLILIIFVVVLIAASLDDDDEVKRYDSACDFNLTYVNLNTCNSDTTSLISLEQYVVDSASAINKNNNLNEEQLKALMIIIKTNALVKGGYNNVNKNITIDDCDISALSSNVIDENIINENEEIVTDEETTTEETTTVEDLTSLYSDISDYLFINSSYTGTIANLNDTSLLELSNNTINALKNESGTFLQILPRLYKDSNLKLYDLEYNCDYEMVDANSALYGNVCGGISLTTTSLDKSQFVALVEQFYSSTSSSDRLQMKNNAGTVYDISKNNSFNPELIPIRAELEGYSPGGSSYNYYGIGCANGAGAGACHSYGSFSSGALAYINLVKGYNVDNLLDVYYVKHYAYIGSHWIQGNSADGGCYYFKYIKKYMSEDRASVVENACSSGVAIPTTDEDQLAYSKWQIESSVNKRKAIFNIDGENCEDIGEGGATSAGCTLYSQMDPRWGSTSLGGSSYTMAGAGCAVTALAIGISCSGTPVTISNFDAGKFINALNSGGCFTGDGDIYWSCSTISKVAPNVKHVTTIWVADMYRTQDKIDQVKKYDPNHHIILLFYRNASTNGHYVAYTSVKGSNFVVKNPAGGKVSEVPISDVRQIVVYSY